MIIKMQEGIRIKSKDIHSVKSIFYLAKDLLFDIFHCSKFRILKKNITIYIISFNWF